MSTVSIMAASYEDCHEAIEKIFHLFPLDLEGKKFYYCGKAYGK